MTTRRNLLIGAASLALLGRARAEPTLTDDGLYKEPWFLESFLELAFLSGGFQIVGKETHFVNFARSDIANYIKANFEVLQFNIIGSRKVTDFDGTEMSEKALAAKYGVRFTPTFQFFPERAGPLKALEPAKREVARLPGYMRPGDFLAMFRYVREKAYESKSFHDFVKALPS